MKVKNIVFSGVMGAILMGATGANAAINVASQGYVDSKVDAVSTAVTDLSTSVSNTYQTKADANTAAQQTSEALGLKANSADVYTKDYVDTELAKLELKTDAIDKLNEAKDYTEAQINALKGALGSGGDGEEGATGLTGQVLTNTSDIVSLKDKVGDKTVAQSIADAIGGLSADSVGAEGSFISTVSQADGTITAGATPFVAEITDATKTSTIAPQTAAVATYIDGKITQIDNGLTEQLAPITQGVTDLGGRVDVLEADNTTNKADIAGIKTEQATQNSAITALQESMAEGGATADAIADAKKAGTDAAAAAATAQAQADKGVADAAAAKSAADAAQEDADANAESISQLQTDLATKITAPAACEKQDCVLSINKASGTISWVPLTEPVEDYLQ